MRAHSLTSKAAILSVIVISILFMTLQSFGQSAGCTTCITRSDPEAIELAIDILDLGITPQVQEGEQRYSISIEGESGDGNPGFPELPHISRLIAVPPTGGIQLAWNGSEPRHILAKPPIIIQHIEQPSEASIKLVELSSITAGLWPLNVVEISDPSIMRGIRMVRVTVNPVQVNPVTGDLTIWDHVNVTLNFGVGEEMNPVRNPNRSRPSEYSLKLARSLVMNPQDISRDDEGRGACLYIAPNYERVAATIQPLVDWRRRQGYPTEVVSIAQNASNVTVKGVIQNAYDEWEIPPEFVCLVGDADRNEASFMVATEDVGRAYMWETDYRYVLLEGDDLLPEAAIGRISARNINELEMIVEKIIGYETDPYLDDPTWLRSAALISNDARTGYSSIYVQRWARKLLLEVGFTEIDTFYFIHDNINATDFMANNINDGINIFNYRGWGQFNGAWSVGDANNLRNGRKLPLMIMPTCNTGDFADHVLFPHGYTEDFLWARNGGAVGAIGSSGFTHTNYNNVVDGGILNGLFRDRNWSFGWCLNQGKLELYRHFGMFNDVQDPQVPSLLTWEAHAYQNNLIGDPATELWTDVPFAPDIAMPASLKTGENQLLILVENPEEETPVADAAVTIIRDGEFIRNGRTDEDGEILFIFDDGELEVGTYQFTVSKHDMVPFMYDLPVEDASTFIGVTAFSIDDDNAGDSEGNSDGLAGLAETIELLVTVTNQGENMPPDSEISFQLERILGDVRIIQGEASLDEAPELGESADIVFLVEIGENNWNGRRTAFRVNASDDANEWESSFEFDIAAPNLETASADFEVESFDPGDTTWVDVTLRNTGRVPSPEMTAELSSLQSEISVFNQFGTYSPIDLDQDTLGTERFRIYAHSQTIPGTSINLLLVLTSEEGFCDSTYLSFVVGSPSDGTPFGPDNYGYGCFDNTDTTWNEAPVYEWVEIDTALEGQGIDTEINDLGNEEDWSALIDLPEEFSFQYYGEDFDQITICSNGWFAFGNESKLADFQNRRIPPALGPRAQVCVFWDDLVNYVDDDHNRIGGVFYWYDEENSRFIIEWSRMRRYIGLDNEGHMRNGAENTFQAILYDPQVYPTYTGDGDIVFQYRIVNNNADVDPSEFDTPYATVGIVNLNGTDGMEYTYWNEYSQGAARLENDRAIKFTTALIIVTGAVRGYVRDYATGEPIDGAQIRGNLGSFTTTRDNGYYFMDNVLIGNNYSFTAWAPGYNDSTRGFFDIHEDETLNLDFELLHPNFALDRESVEVSLRPDNATSTALTLSNSGNGQLSFSSRFDYLEDANSELWNRLLTFNATELTDDNKIQGVEFFDGALWVAGSNQNENPNYFYRFDRQGRLIGRVEQPSRSSYGFRGMVVADGILYGGETPNNTNLPFIFGVNAQGEVVDSIPGPLEIQKAITYDGEYFWVANSTDPLTQIDHEGNIINTFEHELDIQGLGFMRDDPEDFPVYILCRNKTHPDLEVPEALIVKLNPRTGDMRNVTYLEGDIQERCGGMEIVSGFDPTKWVMVAVMTHPEGDRISVYDLGPSTNWISYSPRTGTLNAGEETTIQIEFNSANLIEDDYELALIYEHNAAQLKSEIPIILHVDENANLKDAIDLPLEFRLNPNYPNPFNALTRLSFELPEADNVSLIIFDINGREVARLVDGKLKAGYHACHFDASKLSSGIYLVRLEAGAKVVTSKMALLK